MSAVAAPVRTDIWVVGEIGVRLHVRVVEPGTGSPGRPVVLVHGARAGGVASFDLAVPGGSLAADLAVAGHPVYIMDVRGFGGSTRPAGMDRPPGESPPLVRVRDAAADIAAVVGAVSAWHRAPVGLMGWATGSVWAGLTAIQHPELVSHLVLHNTLYSGSDVHPRFGRGSWLEDPDRPGRVNPALGGYRLSTRADLLGGWDRSIPDEDPSAWRDPAVAEAYVTAALAGDPTSGARTPPSCRSPAGPLVDAFCLATGRQLWDASLIRCRVLVTRGGRDFLSRPEDRVRLLEHLDSAASVDDLELPDGTHFVHLERPERGRSTFLTSLISFLAAG